MQIEQSLGIQVFVCEAIQMRRHSCSVIGIWSYKHVQYQPLDMLVTPDAYVSVHHLICKCDVKITHGGANDLTQYAKSKGYIETERMLLSSKSISDFFPSKSDIQTKVSLNDWSE